MKTIVSSIVAFTFFAFAPINKLTGRWQTPPSETGNVFSILFESDGSFQAFNNKKPSFSGHYTFTDSLFTLTDTGCEKKLGTYKTVFWSNGDSLRMQAISDDCTARKEGIERLRLGRVKTAIGNLQSAMGN